MAFSLSQVETFLRDRIAPVATELDADSVLLKTAFQDLGRQGWLGLRISRQWGGAELGDREFRQFQELLARYSGALAFLQAQHQSAGSFLSRSHNESLQQQFLPRMGNGEVGVGVGFSHLRRAGEPTLQAKPVENGYLLDGSIPWITGYGIFEWAIVAAVLPDQQAIYGMVPLHPLPQAEQAGKGKVMFSEPMQLAAMTASNTVSAQFDQWVLPASQVLFVTPANAIHKSDGLNVLQHSFYALGCAQAALDWMQIVQAQRSLPFIQTAYNALVQELCHCRSKIYAADSQSFSERLTLRAWAIELAVRCAHAAVVVSAGSANSTSHPAQRIYREAMVFSVTGQTTAVMEATLTRLIQNAPDSAQGQTTTDLQEIYL